MICLASREIRTKLKVQCWGYQTSPPGAGTSPALLTGGWTVRFETGIFPPAHGLWPNRERGGGEGVESTRSRAKDRQATEKKERQKREMEGDGGGGEQNQHEIRKLSDARWHKGNRPGPVCAAITNMTFLRTTHKYDMEGLTADWRTSHSRATLLKWPSNYFHTTTTHFQFRKTNHMHGYGHQYWHEKSFLSLRERKHRQIKSEQGWRLHWQFGRCNVAVWKDQDQFSWLDAST